MRHKALVAFPRGGELGWAAALLVAASLTWVLLFAVPAVSQAQSTDPLADEPAQISESADDNDETVDSIVIGVTGCRVAVDATVTVEDDDGTRADLTNGQNVTITDDADQVTIVGTGEGGNLVGISTSGGDGQFGTEGETVTGMVISSTGIACSGDDSGGNGGGGSGGGGGGAGGGTGGPDGDDNAAGDQYNDNVDDPDEVIDDTVPKKPLPKTGGFPLLLGAGVLLACAALVSVRIFRP